MASQGEHMCATGARVWVKNGEAFSSARRKWSRDACVTFGWEVWLLDGWWWGCWERENGISRRVCTKGIDPRRLQNQEDLHVYISKYIHTIRLIHMHVIMFSLFLVRVHLRISHHPNSFCSACMLVLNEMCAHTHHHIAPQS